MHIRNLILTIFTTLTAAMTMAVSLPVCSQELANQDTLVADDSLAVDTIMNNDPEWYVAPMTHDLVRAPFRAPAAACPIDSVRTFNVDSVLESVSVYEYGDTTRTMIWTVNPNDGSRYGSGREESASTANSTYTATYAWDNTTNDWAGTSREEHYFVAGKDTAWLVYAWVDNAWVVNTKYTYVYDASGNETEYTTYQRNAAGQLVYAQRREKTYNGAGQIVLDVQYGSYVNGVWVGSTKYVYDYNASGTQTLYEYYSSCTDGVWNGSIRNVYDFDANGNKVLEEKYSGMTNGEWNGSSKYTASFNAGKEIEHINYKWVSASKSWQENIKYAKTYDGENLTDDASYIWNNGWVGNARTTKTYSGSLVASEIVWQWDSNNAVWTSKSKTETQYAGSRISVQTKSVWDGADWLNLSQMTNTYQSNLLTESYTRSWKEGAWQDSLRTINTYDAKNINTLSVSAAWNGAEWLSTDSTTREVTYATIAGTEYVQEDITMTWSSKTNMWTGVKRDTKEYDAWGNVIQSDTYTYFSGTGWVNNVRRQYAYKNGNKNLETLNLYMTWNKTKGVWSGTTKTEKEYDDTNRLVKTSTYKWNTTHNDWEGLASTEDIYENGIKVTSYSYKWDAATWDWTGMFKHDYIYAASGKIAEQIDWRYDVNTGWYYDVKIANTYDAKGRTIKADRYQWIRTESQWCMTSTNETAYDADADGGKLRVEITAAGSNCEITSYARKLYFYSCDPKYYTIRFVNYDGTALAEDQVLLEGSMPIVPTDPTKQADAQYTYTFAGWDAEPVAVTGDATYTATFSSTVNKYLITFKNGDETLQGTEVEYGSVPAYEGATPTKQADAQYSYAFAGWDAALAAVTGEATYSATFDSTVNKYLITFKNGDETLQSTEVEYGVAPVYTGEMPSRPATAEYTYSFKGWDAELVAVTGEATYSAMFDSIVNTYLVTFKNGEDTLQSGQVAYGTEPTYNGETPVKDGNEQYTYSFKGWDKAIAAVTCAATYNAAFDTTVNTYLITFMNGDVTLQSERVAYGTVPTYNGQTPTKPADAQHSYVFAGWDAELVAVTGEATYTATFTVTEKTYVITWLNNDGSEIGRDTLKYGATPTPAEATKENTAEFTYTFIGWDKAIVPVAGDATYTAQYDSVRNKYTITFYFDDGKTVVETMVVEYGQMPDPTKTPSKIAEEHYYYTFARWEPALAPVTGDASYKAVFDVVPQEYLITFKNYNGRVLQKKNVAYGTIPEYTGATPTKPRTQQYSYTFAGWSPELTEVSGAATYMAWYEEVLNQYTIIFVDEDGTELERQEVEYGKKPVYQGETPVKAEDEQHTYTFAGWTPAIVAVTKNATYRATYTPHDKLQGLWDVQDGAATSTKVIRNGTLYIIRAGKTYTTDGVLVEQ